MHASTPAAMSDHFLLRHYFDVVALTGALAEWVVAWWLLAACGVAVPAGAHVVVPLLLAAVNRVAARRLEHEPARGLLSGTAGHVVLAVSLAGIVGAGALVSVGGAYGAVRWLAGLQADASVVAAGAGVSPLDVEFRLLGCVALGLSFAAIAYGYAYGHRALVVTDVDVPIAGLPAALDGFRIAQVSDLHLGPIASRAALREALARVVALDADVVCITGDIVDTPGADLAAWIPELDALAARHGVLAILGNHDEYVGYERVQAAIERWTRCRVLRNERTTIAVGDARLHVVGLDHQDAPEAGAALDRVLADVPADEPVVLLAHHPNLSAVAAARGIPLMICGHTHGGQLAVPGFPALNIARVLISRYDAGTFALPGTVLHVNRGLGTSSQRVRVGAPPEITVLRLVAA